ncbi:MAG: hypothetical protein N3D20_03155 [Candidatus Pacearchaeota archaeon]|nr:hypothetical protein [Candidatus Pacearchaeota archaeon]
MADIFDTKIMCKKCDKEMEKCIVSKQGVELRAVRCKKCGNEIIHPADLNCLEHFNDLKGKKFNVKLRVVGNSHAISIPKEIINFINEQHKRMRKEMDDMVRLAFEDFGKISISFWDDMEDENE